MKDRIRQFFHKNIWVLILDILAFALSYLFAAYIRFFSNGEMRLAQDYLVFFWHYIPYCTLCSLAVFAVFRLYNGMWQYAGLNDLNRLLYANVITAALHVGISILYIRVFSGRDDYGRMPISYYVIGASIQLAATVAFRFINRFILAEKYRLSRKTAVNVMLVGTGETARMVRRLLEDDPDSAVSIVCIYSYKSSELGTLLNGVPVIGNPDKLKDDLASYKVQRVVIADTLLPFTVREQITAACHETDTELQNLSAYLRYDNNALPFQQLMECVDGKLRVCLDGQTTLYEDGEQALLAINGRHEVKSVSVYDNALFVELVSYKVKPLVVFLRRNKITA